MRLRSPESYLVKEVLRTMPAPISVLLADDHALVRAGIRNVLEDMTELDIRGEVGDGNSLVEILDQQLFDLLLIDVTMPDFDPIPTIRQIKERYPDMRILVVSAYDDDIYVQGLLGAGVDGYHLKDQSSGELRMAIERVLQGERWLSSPLVTRLLERDFSMSRPDTLSPRQRDILELLVQGSDNRSIATELSLSIKTIENHLTRLYRQLNVSSRLEAAAYVHEHPEILQGGVERLSHYAASDAQGELTVLIVDDNRHFRTQLNRMIMRSHPGVSILEADSIDAALDALDTALPELIFIDVVLGDESGIIGTRKLRTAVETATIVLISAYPDREFRATGLSAGATAFLDKKDLDAATIRQIIHDILG